MRSVVSPLVVSIYRSKEEGVTGKNQKQLNHFSCTIYLAVTYYWDRNESRGQDLTRQSSISSISKYDVDKTGGSITKKRSTRRSWRIHNMQAVSQPSSTANSSATTCWTDWLTECPSFTPLAPLAAAVFVVGPPNFRSCPLFFFFSGAGHKFCQGRKQKNCPSSGACHFGDVSGMAAGWALFAPAVPVFFFSYKKKKSAHLTLTFR